MADFKPKPLVDANLITEFGGVEDTEEFQNEGVGHHDYTYVPGFSDSRVARDLDLVRLHNGEIKAKDVSTLDVNCRWYRTVKGSGNDPDQMRMAYAKNEGYRVVTKDDVGQPWLTDVPPGGMIAPDGTIKSAAGDLALFVTGKERAARNSLKKKQRTEEMIDGMDMRVDSNGAGIGMVGKQIRGAEPYVERTIGTQAKGVNQ